MSSEERNRTRPVVATVGQAGAIGAIALVVSLACGGPQAETEAVGVHNHGPAADSMAYGHQDHAEPSVPDEVLSLDVSTDGRSIDVLLARAGEQQPRLVHLRSLDGGRSWSEEHAVDVGGQPPHQPHRGMDAQIAIAGDRLLAVWSAAGTSEWGSGPLATAFSVDGGRSWQEGTNPADDGRTDGHNYIDVVADRQGAFHVVWLDERDGGRGLVTSNSTDGLQWSANRTIDDHTCECCWNKVRAAADGTLQLLYRDKLPTDLSLAVSSDGGQSWLKRGSVAGFGWDFEGCPHVGGALASLISDPEHLQALLWTGVEGRVGLWTVASRDGGVTWSAPVPLGSERAHHSDLAAVGERLIAVWDEGDQILAGWSDPGGRTWATAQKLSGTKSRASHPLVVAAGDAALVAWTEQSSSGGMTWTTRRLE